eukprot:gene9277-12499_t
MSDSKKATMNGSNGSLNVNAKEFVPTFAAAPQTSSNTNNNSKKVSNNNNNMPSSYTGKNNNNRPPHRNNNQYPPQPQQFPGYFDPTYYTQVPAMNYNYGPNGPFNAQSFPYPYGMYSGYPPNFFPQHMIGEDGSTIVAYDMNGQYVPEVQDVGVANIKNEEENLGIQSVAIAPNQQNTFIQESNPQPENSDGLENNNQSEYLNDNNNLAYHNDEEYVIVNRAASLDSHPVSPPIAVINDGSNALQIEAITQSDYFSSSPALDVVVDSSDINSEESQFQETDNKPKIIYEKSALISIFNSTKHLNKSAHQDRIYSNWNVPADREPFTSFTNPAVLASLERAAHSNISIETNSASTSRYNNRNGPTSPGPGSRSNKNRNSDRNYGNNANNFHEDRNEEYPLSYNNDLADNNEDNSSRNRGNEKEAPKYQSIFAKTDENDPDTIVKKGNLILNKLTLTKFDKLSDEFMAINTNQYEVLKRVVDLLVIKAQMEEYLCFMYADLCKKMYEKWTDPYEVPISTNPPLYDPALGASVDESESKTQQTSTLTKGAVFKTLLLERCQAEFEFDRVEALEKIKALDNITEDERVEKELQLKKRYTGHMRFIGELYMKDIIRPTTVQDCLDILLQSDEEEQLVCLCKLFQTIGLTLEQYLVKKAQKAMKKKNETAKYPAVMTGYFDKVQEISNSHPSSRVRFMLKDLIDMKNNNWVARREVEKAVDLSEKSAEKSAVSTNAVETAAPTTTLSVVNPMPLLAEDVWKEVSSSKSKGKTSASSTPLATTTPATNATGAKKGGNSNSMGNSSKSSGNLNGMNNSNTFNGNSKVKNSTSSGRLSNLNNNNNNNNNRSEKGVNNNQSKGAQSMRQPSPSLSSDNRTFTEDNNVKQGPTASQSNAASTTVANPLPSGPLSKSILTKIEATANEYYVNEMITEVRDVLQELSVANEQMPPVIKALIMSSFGKKADDRNKLINLIVGLTSEWILSPASVKQGVFDVLAEFDEQITDFPLVGSYVSIIIGNLISKRVLELSLFAEDDERVKRIYLDAKIDVLSLITPFPRQTKEEALLELAQKHQVSFII